LHGSACSGLPPRRQGAKFLNARAFFNARRRRAERAAHGKNGSEADGRDAPAGEAKIPAPKRAKTAYFLLTRAGLSLNIVIMIWRKDAD